MYFPLQIMYFIVCISKYMLPYNAHILNDKSHAERCDKVWDEKEMGMKAGV